MMLTQKTLDTITLLCEAERRKMMAEQDHEEPANHHHPMIEYLKKCDLLDTHGFPIKPLSQTSLLDVLTKLNEKIYPVLLEETEDKLYGRYGSAGRKLGVINQMMHDFLQKVDITELMTR